MTGDELIAYTREDLLHDTATPRLWSDDLILRYLNEAQNLFCRLTHCLTPSDGAIDIVELEEGESSYSINSKALFINSAAVQGASQPLRDYTYRALPNLLAESTGQPRMFVLNERNHTIRFFPVPDQAYTVNLLVATLPLRQITFDTEPEIPEQYHIDLPEFAAFRCLRNTEVDGSNLGSADTFEKSWRDRVAEAKREYYRLRTGPSATARNNWTGKRK
jgi:hypothetical protein